MKPGARPTLVTAAILAVGLALGCGGDKKSSQPEDDTIIDIADGTWREVTTVEWSGANEGCDILGDLITDSDTTFVQCELDVRDLGDAGEDCDITIDGGSVTIDCASAQTSGPCIMTLTVAGTAEVGNTSYTSDVTITLTVVGDAQACGGFTCTGTVHVTGTWISTEGACP
jgi:hypothetical protein